MLANLTLPQLHDHVRAMTIPVGDTLAHDAFYRLLSSYKTAETPQRLDQIATACHLRAVRQAELLPLDLIAAYARLESLARWRAAQIREDHDARR